MIKIGSQTKIKEPSNGLMQIEFPSSFAGGMGLAYEGSHGKVREAIGQIFDVSSHYVLIRTRANPQAVRLLDDANNSLERRGSDSRLHYSNNLMDLYLNTLGILANEEQLAVASYPLIDVNAHNTDRHWDQVTWPTIHVIRESLNGLKNNRKYINSI